MYFYNLTIQTVTIKPWLRTGYQQYLANREWEFRNCQNFQESAKMHWTKFITTRPRGLIFRPWTNYVKFWNARPKTCFNILRDEDKPSPYHCLDDIKTSSPLVGEEWGEGVRVFQVILFHTLCAGDYYVTTSKPLFQLQVKVPRNDMIYKN